MAAQNTSKRQTRKRNRKAGTEVSSDESSSSSGSIPESPPPKSKKSSDQQEIKRIAQPSTGPSKAPDTSRPEAESEAAPETNEPARTHTSAKQHQDAFEQFYLSQATKELANDLDKLRSAGDWKGERSIGLLVRALKQGSVGLAEEERGRVGGVR